MYNQFMEGKDEKGGRESKDSNALKDNERFIQRNERKRKLIYRWMLKFMQDVDRFKTVDKLCHVMHHITSLPFAMRLRHLHFDDAHTNIMI